MARTDGGALLSVQHRNAQLRLRSRALRDYTRVWPLWRGDRRSFDRLVAATLPLVESHHAVSAETAAAYYGTFRRAEKVPGGAARVLPAVDLDRVASSLYVTGAVMTGKAINAGKSPQAAMQVALTRTAGAVGRHVLAGGRDTLVHTARADSRSDGVLRIVAGGACEFCQSLAGQPTTGDFQAHDHCGCSAEPFFA